MVYVQACLSVLKQSPSADQRKGTVHITDAQKDQAAVSAVLRVLHPECSAVHDISFHCQDRRAFVHNPQDPSAS